MELVRNGKKVNSVFRNGEKTYDGIKKAEIKDDGSFPDFELPGGMPNFEQILADNYDANYPAQMLVITSNTSCYEAPGSKKYLTNTGSNGNPSYNFGSSISVTPNIELENGDKVGWIIFYFSTSNDKVSEIKVPQETEYLILSNFIPQSGNFQPYKPYSGGVTNLKYIKFINNSHLRDMTSYEGLFKNCEFLERVDGENIFKTDNSMFMREAFYNCKKLRNLIEKYKFKVKDNSQNYGAAGIFYNNYYLTKLNVDFSGVYLKNNNSGYSSTWDSSVFSGCSNLKEVIFDGPPQGDPTLQSKPSLTTNKLTIYSTSYLNNYLETKRISLTVNEELVINIHNSFIICNFSLFNYIKKLNGNVQIGGQLGTSENKRLCEIGPDIKPYPSTSSSTDLHLCPMLTRQSLLNLINNMTTTQAGSIVFGSDNLKKLTTAEKNSILAKGWSYS